MSESQFLQAPASYFQLPPPGAVFNPSPLPQAATSAPPPVFPFPQPAPVAPIQTAEEVELKVQRRRVLLAISDAFAEHRNLLDAAAAVQQSRARSALPAFIWNEEFNKYVSFYSPQAGPSAETNPLSIALQDGTVVPAENVRPSPETDKAARETFRRHLLSNAPQGTEHGIRTEVFVAEMDRFWAELAAQYTPAPDLKVRDQELNRALRFFKLMTLYDASYYRDYARAIATGGPVPM